MWKRMFLMCVVLALLLGSAGAIWMNYATSSNEVITQFSKPIYMINISGKSFQSYHPLLGQRFNFDPLPLGGSPIATTSKIEPLVLGSVPAPHYVTDFGQNWEKNMKYAQTKSSFRVAENNKLSSLGPSWNIFDTGWIVI